MISFRARLVTMDETCLYHSGPETKQQSMEWLYSCSSHPQNIPSAKNRWKRSLLDFLESRRHPPHCYLPKGQTINAEKYSFLLVQFWRKKTAGCSPKRFCSCTTTPRLTGHSQHRINWSICVSSFLITHPILRIWARRTTTCSPDWQKQLKIRHFSFEAEVISASETWLDGQISELFEWLANLEQRTKKFIELRGFNVG